MVIYFDKSEDFKDLYEKMSACYDYIYDTTQQIPNADFDFYKRLSGTSTSFNNVRLSKSDCTVALYGNVDWMDYNLIDAAFENLILLREDSARKWILRSMT